MARDEKIGEKVAVSAKAIEELPGVGPATAEKLREAGFTDLMGLAVASPQMIADAAELGTNVAQKIIIAAREAVDIGGVETRGGIPERREGRPEGPNPSEGFGENLGGGPGRQAPSQGDVGIFSGES